MRPRIPQELQRDVVQRDTAGIVCREARHAATAAGVIAAHNEWDASTPDHPRSVDGG